MTHSDIQDANVSVVYLCYNDAGSIAHCVTQCIKELSPSVRQLEIIVVEDGSTDGSNSILRDLQMQHRCLDVIWHERNQGYGASLSDGILRARNEFILCSDGDGQFKIEDFYRLFDDMADGVDIVGGSRSPRADESYRRLFGNVFNAIVRSLLAPDLDDVDCGFKLFRASSIKRLLPVKSRMAVWVEIMHSARKRAYKCKSVPVRHLPRCVGRSTAFTWSNIVILVSELCSILTEHWSPTHSDEELNAHSAATAKNGIK